MKYLLLTSLLLLAGSGLGAKEAPSPEDVFASRLQPVRAAFPSDWNFVLMEESAWTANFKTRGVNTATAFTVLAEHRTYVRLIFAVQASPDKVQHVLLHEAGHVHCQCVNEWQADRFIKSFALGQISGSAQIAH